jgi:hypothetical protein
LDDGIPYYPTLTAIAESPVEAGVLFVGTDDGNVRVSRDGGRSWADIADRAQGLPSHAWINGIEASRVVPGRVYLAANDYRNDDYGNYLFASEDYGETWRDLTGTLPPERIVRTIREDPRNPDVLYLGTEFGAFYSLDRGASWIELKLGLPTAAVNDLVIHPRDNDLILGTHGRGIWILDNINALQEVAGAMGSAAYLFSPEPAEQIRYRSEKGHAGNMIFRGSNPPSGAILDFWLAEEGQDAEMTVRDQAGEFVASLPVRERQGINRVTWNLRYAEADQPENAPPRGPLVVPGSYLVRLESGSAVSEAILEVREDPRIQVDMATREQWTEDLLALGILAREAEAGAEEMRELAEKVESDPSFREALTEWSGDLLRQWNELRSRTRGLIREVESWVGPLSQDQASRRDYFQEMVGTLGREAAAIAQRIGDASSDPRGATGSSGGSAGGGGSSMGGAGRGESSTGGAGL